MIRVHTIAAGGGSILKYAADRFQVGPESAGEFITHRFAIDQIGDALEAVRQRKVIKALLSYA